MHGGFLAVIMKVSVVFEQKKLFSGVSVLVNISVKVFIYYNTAYLVEALVRSQYSAAGPQSPYACDLNLNLLGSLLSSAGFLSAPDKFKKKKNTGLSIITQRTASLL